jgi:hypothetical protein
MLGEVAAARDLDQDTLERRRRVLGADHPDTLTSASNLAGDLRALGEAGDRPGTIAAGAGTRAAVTVGCSPVPGPGGQVLGR